MDGKSVTIEYEAFAVTVNPSTELIPDEYEHSANNTVQVHVFIGDEHRSKVEQFVDTMGRNGCDCHVHVLIRLDKVLEDLRDIKVQDNMKALMILFVGLSKADGEFLLASKETISIEDVWNEFTVNNCVKLKNKPKIFLFFPVEFVETKQSDGTRHFTSTYDQVYDIPSEADMLIVYKQFDNIGVPMDFMDQLSFNIDNYGKRDDIIELITQSVNGSSKMMPLIISTLTKKFFATSGRKRGSYLAVNENHDNVSEVLQEIKAKVDDVVKRNLARNSRTTISHRSAVTDSASSLSGAAAAATKKGKTTDPKRRSTNSKPKDPWKPW